MWHFQTQDHYKIFVWNKLEQRSESVEQIKTKQRMKGATLQIENGEQGINTSSSGWFCY